MLQFYLKSANNIKIGVGLSIGVILAIVFITVNLLFMARKRKSNNATGERNSITGTSD